MVSAPVGIDDEIGGKVAARRLDQDVDLGCISGSAGRIADDPAHGVARRDWSRAAQLLARLKRDVGDLAGRSIDLIECAFRSERSRGLKPCRSTVTRAIRYGKCAGRY